MNTIKKNAQYFKTNLLKLVVLLTVIIFSSCNDDPIQKDAVPLLGLTFNLETDQDQMGDFFGNAMAVYEGKVWSVGGGNAYSDNLNSEIWNSINGTSWVSVAEIGSARIGHTLTTFKNKLWLIGGENDDGDWLDFIRYSTDGSSWINLPFLRAPFGAVAHHSTVVFNGKMYVIAGKRATNTTEVWSTSDGETWSQETANAFSGRVGHKAIVLNNIMYVIGGEDIGANKLNEIWQSTDGIDWTLVTHNSSVFLGRIFHTATVYNDKVWIIGGRTATDPFINEIYYSDNLTDWTKYSGSNPLEPIAGHETLLYNDALWVFGGKLDETTEGVTGKIWSIKED